MEKIRKVIGQFLADRVKELNLSIYDLEKSTGMPGHQIKGVMDGSKNYTIDSFFKIIRTLDIYIFFSEKRGKKNMPVDIEHMMKKMNESDPDL